VSGAGREQVSVARRAAAASAHRAHSLEHCQLDADMEACLGIAPH
jgi:hypothetical protein